MAKESFSLLVNGDEHVVEAEPDEPLLWIIRDNLGLTGTKFGCGEGACGACAVLMDNRAVRSCVVTVKEAANGQQIVTIEGLGKNGELSKMQKAFIKYNAFCCGFCTPGMIICAVSLLNRNPDPSREEIKKAMNANLCRCASYVNIIEAIESVVKGG